MEGYFVSSSHPIIKLFTLCIPYRRSAPKSKNNSFIEPKNIFTSSLGLDVIKPLPSKKNVCAKLNTNINYNSLSTPPSTASTVCIFYIKNFYFILFKTIMY